MRSGETVPRSVPIPSPGIAARSELGFCRVASLLALAAGGVEPLPDEDRDEEPETAVFPEKASPPKTDDELVVTKFGVGGAHGGWEAGEAKQVEVVVVEALADVASAASGWLCPCAGAPRNVPPDWGRNETTPTSKRARASPPAAPAKKPPLLMLSS
jgi:hypothetical protein